MCTIGRCASYGGAAIVGFQESSAAISVDVKLKENISKSSACHGMVVMLRARVVMVMLRARVVMVMLRARAVMMAPVRVRLSVSYVQSP